MIRLFKVGMSPHAKEVVGEVLGSGYIGQGPVVEEFEEELQRALELPRRPITVNSGTSALDLALHLAGVQAGDEVITVPLTCTATNIHIIHRGASPVWADVDSSTGLAEPSAIRASVTERTRAVMVVDWGGAPVDLSAIRAVLPSHIPIILDAAHTLSWRPGADYVCWSFQAIKFLTTGDGGMILCPDDETTERARLLRWFGLDRRSSESFRCSQRVEELGFKYHMNDISAAIGMSNLSMAQWHRDDHRINGTRITESLQKPLRGSPGGDYWVCFIQTPARAEFQSYMAAKGIETSLVHMRNDVHPGFQSGRWLSPPLGLGLYDPAYVAVPCGWWLTQSDLRAIMGALEKWASSLRIAVS